MNCTLLILDLLVRLCSNLIDVVVPIGEPLTWKNFCGTINFAYPTLKVGEPAQPFRDLYSAGVVFLHLVPHFHNPSIHQVQVLGEETRKHNERCELIQ